MKTSSYSFVAEVALMSFVVLALGFATKEENESAASSSATAADDEGNAQHTATSILSVTKHVNKDSVQGMTLKDI
eukprot:4691741-Amphidinium_carterae.1